MLFPNAVEHEERDKRKVASAVFLICVLVFSAIYITDVLKDWNYFGLNPPDSMIRVPVLVDTYLTAPLSGGQARPVDMSFELDLYSRGLVVENQTIAIYGHGFIFHHQQNISYLFLSFEHILSPSSNRDEHGFLYTTGMTLTPVTRFQNGSATLTRNSTLGYWAVEGDYAVVVGIVLVNGSKYSTLSPQSSVHVSSASELITERYSKVNQALTVALFLFAVVQGFSFVLEALEKEKSLIVPLHGSEAPERGPAPQS